MSTPDARLNAAERAALADLEAAAAASDPSLAQRLRGGRGRTPRPILWKLSIRAARVWAFALGSPWLGWPLAVIGCALMVLGLSAGLVLSVIGAVVFTLGLRLVVGLAGAVLGRRLRR